MAKWLGFLILLLLASAAAFFVLFQKPQQQALLAAEQGAAACAQEGAGLRAQVADLTAIRDQLRQSGAQLAQQVREKEQELRALRSTQDEMLTELKVEIADKTVQVERIRDQLRVELVDEVLFDSGETTLKPAGVAVLRKIGGVLARSANRRVEVQGHTDSVPIAGALAQRFPTNWELSAARATNVVRFLQDEARLDPRLLSASGYAEYRPRASNDSEAGRRQNRRIEILLLPLLPAENPATP